MGRSIIEVLTKELTLDSVSKDKGEILRTSEKRHSRQKERSRQTPLGPENKTSGEHLCKCFLSTLGCELLKKKNNNARFSSALS